VLPSGGGLPYQQILDYIVNIYKSCISFMCKYKTTSYVIVCNQHSSLQFRNAIYHKKIFIGLCYERQNNYLDRSFSQHVVGWSAISTTKLFFRRH
jgi:hypothetical protein